MSIKQRADCGRYICKQGLSLSSLGTGMMMMTMGMIWGTTQECQQKKRQVSIFLKKRIIHRIPVYELSDCICQTFYLPDLNWQFEGGAGAAAGGNCVAC